MSDSAYQEQYESLGELCQEYLDLLQVCKELNVTPDDGLQLQVGMILGKCADIYNLSPPGGVMHPSMLFRKE